MEDALFVIKMYQLLAAMHILLKEVNGGLGIKENIVTLCPDCHYEEDFGNNAKLYEEKIEIYLKGIYGANWDKSKLVYKKY